MKNEIACCIVRDLLPNYIDKLTEDETNIIIEEHLINCHNCKLMYDEMSNEVEVNTMQRGATKENKIKEFLEKARLGYTMNMIFKIIKIVTIVLYTIMNVVMLYVISSNTQYYTITERVTFENTLLLFSITLLIPALLISLLFIQKKNKILKGIKAAIQVVLLISFPFICIIGLIISLRMPSSTTNALNYENREMRVEELLSNKDFAMLPEALPDNVADIAYFYKYEAIFDDNYLTLEVSWSYNDDQEYQNAKAQMQSYQPVNNEAVEAGFNMRYAIGSNSKDNKKFCFGYDDSTKRVIYKIYYEWI